MNADLPVITLDPETRACVRFGLPHERQYRAIAALEPRKVPVTFNGVQLGMRLLAQVLIAGKRGHREPAWLDVKTGSLYTPDGAAWSNPALRAGV